MLDASSDTKRANYSRDDDSARRLWLTQRTRANPWEHRAQDQEAEERPQSQLAKEIAARAPEAPATTIAQDDVLRLAVHEADGVENPFASLLASRFGV